LYCVLAGTRPGLANGLWSEGVRTQIVIVKLWAKRRWEEVVRAQQTRGEALESVWSPFAIEVQMVLEDLGRQQTLQGAITNAVAAMQGYGQKIAKHALKKAEAGGGKKERKKVYALRRGLRKPASTREAQQGYRIGFLPMSGETHGTSSP
jgi:hypothetical protein